MRIIIKSPIEIEIVEGGKRDSLAGLLPLALPFLASLMGAPCKECDDESGDEKSPSEPPPMPVTPSA